MSQPESRKKRFKGFKRRTLVEEIKDILNKYPDDGQIFKELIQNAEDAGATEIVFIYDQNDYTSNVRRYSADGIKTLQGPCLYAYNNGYFDENDWDGIRSLAISNKRTDPLKVGRFGLGFKSVFHLTDVPCIASESSMAYLDPLNNIFDHEMEFLEFEEEEADAEKLYNFGDFNCYRKIPEKFSINSKGYCNGTVFRFPLRRSQSPISMSLYTQKRMKNLIETFMAEGSMNLLFLKNIKSIKIFIVKENGTPEELYQVCFDKYCNRKYGESRQQFVKNVREQTEKGSFSPLTVNHCVDLIERENGKESKHSFVLSEVYGYSGSDQLRELIEDPDLFYVPLVGIAFPLNENSGGHVYCGLPLPITEKSMTGLPVHVNGYFSLSDDRRDLRWKTISSKVSNDKSAVWNEYLIEKLVPDAYCNMMKYLLHLNEDHNIFYSAWPDQDMVNEKWRMFLKRLYELMFSFNSVFITSKGTWNNVQSTVFLKKDVFESKSIYHAVKNFLERTPFYTGCVPTHVLESLPDATTVTNELILKAVRNYPDCYKELGREEQIDLLSYAIKTTSDVNKLDGLHVLPLVNGNYGAIKQSQQHLIYVPTYDHPADVLPTEDDVLDLSLLSRAPCLLKVLQKASTNGNTNLCLLDHWNKVLAAIRKIMSTKYAGYQVKNKWLENFWNYRRQQDIPINQLDGMHLIPVSGQIYLHEIRTASLLMLTSYTNQFISHEMKTFLKRCGLEFADNTALEYHVWDELSSEQKILFPDSNGIITALDYAAKRIGEDCLSSLCAKESDKLRNEIVMAANYFTSPSFPSVIMKLPLFKVFGRSDFTSIDQSILVDKRYIPNVWQSDFPNIIESESVPCDILEKVSITRWNFEDIIRFLFEYKFSSLNMIDKDKLYIFVLKFISKNEVTEDFLSLLKQYLVIKSGNIRKRPSDLFQCNPEMKLLFYGENDKFPDVCYSHYSQGLIKLGLKREQEDISSNDIANSIYVVQNLQSTGIVNIDVRKKVNTILQISKLQDINLSQFRNSAWIPIMQEKPYGYPQSLYWVGSDTFGLDTPNNVFSKKYIKIVGSINTIVHEDVSLLFHNIFDYQSPSAMLVCRHLQNIVQSYNEGESLPYKNMTESIYGYLSECNFNEVVANLKTTVTKVLHDNCFINFEEILKHKLSISVEPYYYCLSDAVPNSFHKFVMKLGNGLQETDIYIDVLQKMFEKYHDNQDVTLSSDLELSVKMIKYLAEKLEKIPEEKKSLICVPVASRFIKYCKLKDCFYHSSGGQHFRSVAEYNILHPSLDEDIARKLDIPNIISKMFSDDDLFESWGQGEPLLLRLNRLLKDYEDGMAIPKELIQNADDAGATEVSFLYDERDHNGLKTTLFHPDMKEWQGPALWVFNDSQFSEEDFESITRLNAGTKSKNLTKIGKFGLGFNVVYHLTDVPSFISGQRLVIFDPHTIYLGDALKDKSKPGVRVDFLSSKKDCKHFSDQFKVFDGVFGAKMDFDENNVATFPGTLFRLPLRNSKTADHSCISKLVYSDKEMDSLLLKLRASLNHLLLFTQNVKNIKCFHLGKDAKSVTEMKLKFSVCKETNSSPQRNVVKLGYGALKQFKANFHFPILNVQENVIVTVNDQNAEEKSNWFISSCIGGQSSFEFAKRRSGFNPCGGVAIRYELNSNGNISLFDEKNRCFMFCFLPLPENSHLPVHVNGAFEISNDRKHLMQHTCDEKSYGEATEWNSLLGGDIGEAYYNLLLWLKSKIVDVSLESWLSVMPSLPLPAENKCIMELCKSLMVKILTRNENLFPYPVNGGISWTKWNCLILTNKLPMNLQSSAIKFMNWLEKLLDTGKVCLDIPCKFIQLMEKLVGLEALTSSFISASQFYQEFFRYIGHKSLDKTLQNNILKIIVSMQSSEEELSSLLSSVPCIPTEPNGTLKVPSDLVQPDSKVAMLYELSDEVFPLKEFEVFDVDLVKLGMNVQTLPWPLLFDRAKSIESCSTGLVDANSIVLLKKKSTLLVQVMKDNIHNCSSDIKGKLLSASFLPVMRKPLNAISNNWYAGESLYFASPNELFEKSLQNVVCYVGLLCEDTYDDELSRFLNLKKIASLEIVSQQLEEISVWYEKSKAVEKNTKIADVLSTIYRHIENYHMDACFDEIANLKFIQTDGGKLVQPDKVYVSIDQEIDGYLYKLPFHLTCHHNLMIKLGVQEICTVQTYLKILNDIKARFDDKPVSDMLLKSILHHIIPFLINKISEDTSFKCKNLYLPDYKKVMQSVSDMVFRDPTWFPVEDGVLCVNDGIPPQHCKQLGVQSARNSCVEQNSIGFEFGQHEDTCTRIKSLLKGYNTEDVLYEILQNADDAGATEVEFIFDTRYHNDEQVLSEKWRALQGPALLVTNNGVFTKSDLKAIQSLGEGSKSTDALKTGKYGVGFNVVYNITDCPSLLTKIDGKDDVLCIFDPNLQFVSGGTKEKPGRMFCDARKLIREKFTDMQSTYLLEDSKYENKTVFRFPLRTEGMALHSWIPDKVVTVERMKEMLKKLEHSSLKSLLFLNNVNTVSFETISKKGKSESGTFKVKTHNTAGLDDFRNFQKEFISRYGPLLGGNKKLKRLVCLQLFRNGKFVNSDHLQVFEQCGFSNFIELPMEIKRKALCLVPKGAVACSAEELICDRCYMFQRGIKYTKKWFEEKLAFRLNDKRDVFCTLPLSEESDLPVLINGNFMLDSESRRSLWTGNNESFERIWNNAILTNCVSSCYVDLLVSKTSLLRGGYVSADENMEGKIRSFYSRFPGVYKSKEEDSSYWDHLKLSVYQIIYESNLAVLAVQNKKLEEVRFCKPNGSFIVYPKLDTSISTLKSKVPSTQLLQTVHIDTDTVPNRVKKGFDVVKFPLTSLSPVEVKKLLCKLSKRILPGPCKVVESIFQTKENVVSLLDYCIETKKQDNRQTNRQNRQNELKKDDDLEEHGEIKRSIDLRNLPLSLLADETVELFTSGNEKFLTSHPTLIIGKESLFLHEEIWKIFNDKGYRQNDFTCIKSFSLKDFASLLPNVLPKVSFEKVTTHIHMEKSGISIDWLESVWEFIQSELQDDDSLSLEPIKNWSLLLCQQNQEFYLMPITKGKCVLNLAAAENRNKFYKGLVDSLRDTFNVFELPGLHSSLYEKHVKNQIFGSVDNCGNLIDALLHCYKEKCFEGVNAENADRILSAFNQSIKDIKDNENLKVKLKRLPLYERYDEATVNDGCGKLVCTPNADIPMEGLDTVETVLGYHFLKNKPEYERLYRCLDYSFPDVFSLYRNIIFEAFRHLSDDAVHQHMLYIRKYLDMYHHTVNTVRDFIEYLKKVNFIRCGDIRKCASDLFDPNNELFKLMLDASDFPSDTYMEETWYAFLEKLGLVKEIDQKMFIRFAKKVSKENDAEKALQASRILCEKLFTIEEFECPRFLEEVRQINFIVPEKLPEWLEEIHCSKIVAANFQKICFENSAPESMKELCWTTVYILPAYAHKDKYIKINTKDQQDERNCTIKDNLVISHINNIINSSSLERRLSHCVDMPERLLCPYQTVLKCIYHYLQHNGFPDEFKHASLILVADGKSLGKPSKTVLESPTIPPYLNRVWSGCGEYFDLFERLGCCRYPTIKHFQSVLEEIQQASSACGLSTDQEHSVKKAVTYLAERVCREGMSLSGLLLYLPTITFQCNDIYLTKSNEAIFVDDFHLENRLKNFTEEVLIFSYDDNPSSEDKTNAALVEYLPEKMRPKTFSDVIQEELFDDGENVLVGSDHISEQIKTKFGSIEFMKGIERLIKHQQKSTCKATNTSEQLETVTKTLQKVKVHVRNEVLTYISYHGQKIEGSEESKPVYLKLQDNVLQIYLSTWISDPRSVYASVTQSLLKLFRNIIRDTELAMFLLLLLQSPCSEIKNMLDHLGVRKDYSESYLPFGKPQEPGDLVPLEHYPLLRNGLSLYEKDDLLAMEIEEDGSIMYVYVIVRSVKGDVCCASQKTYGVQISKDTEDIVYTKGYNLFRFQRLFLSVTTDGMYDEKEMIDEEEHPNYEDIISEIQQELRNCSEEERKKIARRLYLRWHPDKNPDKEKVLATKVFQFIQNELEDFNEGFRNDFQQWNERAEWEFASYQSYHQSYTESYSGSRQSFNGLPTFQRYNPQPEEAKRWFKQAKFDLNQMEDAIYNEWVCFLAHQAAEKSLKAVNYLKHYEEIHLHNLVTISAALPTDLQALASELESLIKSSAHLRYPNCWPRPDIPHSKYTKEMADDAGRLAKRIVAMAGEQIDNIKETL